jgi:hypothetical protein
VKIFDFIGRNPRELRLVKVDQGSTFMPEHLVASSSLITSVNEQQETTQSVNYKRYIRIPNPLRTRS